MEVARAARSYAVAAHCRSARVRDDARCHGVEVIYHANYADERALDALRPRATASSSAPRWA
mgnify:CR=1 FL=1